MLLFLTLANCGMGQQLNQYSLSQFNLYKDFGAYAGFEQKLVLSGHLRNQWVAHPGNPTFQYIGANMPIFNIKSGLGLDFENISEGNFHYRKARTSFNKVLNFGNAVISTGIRLSFNQLAINGKTILTPEGDYNDGSINHNDRQLSRDLERGYGIGYELSTFIRYNLYQFGLSISETPTHEIRTTSSGYRFKEQLNLFFSGIFIFSENIQFQPSMAFRTDFNTIQTDLSGILNLNGNIFGGLVLRGYNSKSLDAIGITFGHKINRKYSVYYNYDLPISSIKRTNEGSHELLLKMNFETLFGKPNNPKIIYNPRFLN